MAIVVERVEGSKDLIKTYSDAGMKIRQDQTGIIYTSAFDIETSGYTYTETNIPIKQEKSSIQFGGNNPFFRRNTSTSSSPQQE